MNLLEMTPEEMVAAYPPVTAQFPNFNYKAFARDLVQSQGLGKAGLDIFIDDAGITQIIYRSREHSPAAYAQVYDGTLYFFGMDDRYGVTAARGAYIIAGILQDMQIKRISGGITPEAAQYLSKFVKRQVKQ